MAFVLGGKEAAERYTAAMIRWKDLSPEEQKKELKEDLDKIRKGLDKP